MAGKLTGLSKFFDPGLELSLPTGRGDEERPYVIPLASAETGLWCQMAAQAGAAMHRALDENSTEAEMQAAIERVEAMPAEGVGAPTLAQRTLGTAYDKMVADGIADAYIQFAGATAFAWIVGGEEQAERFWRSGGNPKAGSPANRAERRAEAKHTTSTGRADATRSAASTSGTTSRTRSRRSGRARRSPGTSS